MTAVEWLMNRLEFAGIKDLDLSDDIYLQAKAMEREQIEHSYLTCWKDYVNEGKHWEMGMNPKETFIDYYNETYGSKGSDELEKSENPINLTSSQTEISDEEIEIVALNKFMKGLNNDSYLGFIQGAKWYREQLKSRQ